jgi:transcriptional regulator GlxA family with amidase domain
MGYGGPGNPDHDAKSGIQNDGQRSVRAIGVVLFDGFSLLTVGVIPEAFQMANELHTPRLKGQPIYDVRFYSAEGGGIACSSAINVWTYACDARHENGFDALFIADGKEARRAARDVRLVDWLREVLPISEIVKPIGEGRLLLEAAQAHPPERYMDGDATMSSYATWSAGTALGDSDDRHEPTRTALGIIRRDLGVETAREIARRLVSDRTSALTSLLSDAHTVTVGEKVRNAARWLKENCERSISVADAARVAAMSGRTFLRCFKKEIGVTPSEFLLQVRLDMTVRLLDETDWSIDRIARRCGWINGERLAKIFRRRLALTPSEYRLRAHQEKAGRDLPDG